MVFPTQMVPGLQVYAWMRALANRDEVSRGSQSIVLIRNNRHGNFQLDTSVTRVKNRV